jgi:hypothetical protein
VKLLITQFSATSSIFGADNPLAVKLTYASMKDMLMCDWVSNLPRVIIEAGLRHFGARCKNKFWGGGLPARSPKPTVQAKCKM